MNVGSSALYGFILFHIPELLSDILSYVLAKGVKQQNVGRRQLSRSQLHGGVSRHESRQVVKEEVIRNCFKLLHALAYKNDMVRAVHLKNNNKLYIFVYIYKLLYILFF